MTVHTTTTYERVLALLDGAGCAYREIAHRAEGRTDMASLLRGHPLRQSAKSIVLRVALGRKRSAYVLAVVPGDRRVDLAEVARTAGGTRADFADRASAERLTGCVSGAIVPFSFDDRLRLVVDPELLDEDEIWFNAARLDRSLAMSPRDWAALAEPLFAPVAEARRATVVVPGGAAGGR
ncbi:YbaK/EbsC family protein [Streptomyces sp. VRA16 Mangrove soil]|uniref:YbaK/EbsC family protein n=1 Tax=Streptomyces sp. VRA16 Mangrove soil TaxID=2817434 RepID=UPI001AA00415|nr:YbaK/EbsC family protein [Streptomyces sp. VRA16 Mangrove soil]MBO1334071.1 YbaK/prolyl-tRNA synthetase associated domain-containing protein [Streptomyces sp. VRA16 Mangrove soil]